jgi:glucose/arabinose dehydrogenase
MYLLFLRFSLLPFLLGLLFYNSDKRIPKDDSVVQDDVQLTEPLTPEEAQKRFKLPEGFKIELYASEPEIGKPMNIAFDEKGRLWVTESQEYPFAASLGKGKDRMMILEDRDGDGRAEIKTVFADTLNIPIGILPYQSGAIAFSIPNIYQFVDIQKNPKGKSGVLVGPFGHKDTHGMVNNLMRGYDGWVYVCHGFSNVSNPFGTDGSQLSLSSGNTFRFKTDGTQLQQTTYGRVNPFGQTLDEWGYLYSIDCHTSPLYQLIEGGDYPHFGKIEKGIGFAPVMKPHETEATAISGIAYYSDDQFPQAFQKNFFVGDVVKSRIYRYSSHFKGASPVAKLEEDFLTTDDPWFRPVDVKLGPDGAIYIADFYNRIIGHYEVPLDHPGRDRMRGRIWRISYEGKHPKNIQKRKKTDWTKASFSALWEGLNTPNLELRMQLINALSDRLGQAAVAPLKKKFAKNQLTNSQYVSGLWTLYRLNALEESLLTAALVHADPLVRTHALRIIKSGNTFNLDVLAISRQALQDPVSHVQRVAVSILGGLKDPKVMPELLNFAVKVAPQDDHLVYEVRLAIRELLKNEQVVSFVKTSTWDTSKANLLAQ